MMEVGNVCDWISKKVKTEKILQYVYLNMSYRRKTKTEESESNYVKYKRHTQSSDEERNDSL